jgi:long-subunit fatty acid transport protein
VIKGVHPTSKFEKLPEYYAGEVLPAEQKGDISALKSWIERVKWADMTEMDLRLEYNKNKGTTNLSPLTMQQRETLKDSIAYKVGRKLWYLGRRSVYETDGEFNRRTRHMRPAMGSYSSNDTWTVAGGFPYDESFQYTSGELPALEEKLKAGESIKW